MGCDCSPRWFIEERQYVSQERGTCSAKSIFTGMLLVSFTNPLVLSEAGNLSCCLGCSSFINLSRMFHVAETFRSLQSGDVDLVRMWTRRGNSLFFRSFRNLIKRNHLSDNSHFDRGHRWFFGRGTTELSTNIFRMKQKFIRKGCPECGLISNHQRRNYMQIARIQIQAASAFPTLPPWDFPSLGFLIFLVCFWTSSFTFVCRLKGQVVWPKPSVSDFFHRNPWLRWTPPTFSLFHCQVLLIGLL